MRIAGFGCRAAATEESLRDAFDRAAAGLAVGMLAAPSDKAAFPALRVLAGRLGLPLVGVAAGDLAGAATLTQSLIVMATRGTGSVAEAAALHAAAGIADGRPVRLIGPRAVSADRMATCAVAIVEGMPG